MFEAITSNQDLLAMGCILPTLRGGPDTMEGQATRWADGYRSKDSAMPVFFQSKPARKGNIDEILRRADYFRDNPYRALVLDPPDRSGVQERFLSGLERVLAEEPRLEDSIKDAVRERARGASPLGGIRHDVLRKYWKDPVRRRPVEELARRINICFFAAGAGELKTWFSMNDAAFRDLTQATAADRARIFELIELSVDRTLAIPAEKLVGIRPEDFADIVGSAEASRFRRKVRDVIVELNDNATLNPEPGSLESSRLVQQARLRTDFLDTYSRAFGRAMRKRRDVEQRRSSWGLHGGLIGLGVATDLLTGLSPFPLPGVGPLIGEGAAIMAGKILKSKITPPLILLQERLRKAADSV